MEPQLTIYSCPHCAEKIQRQAVACRFCGRPVTWSFSIIAKPAGASFATLLRELYDTAGKSRYASYGAMRRAADQSGVVLFQGLNREEADAAGMRVSRNGGEARIELDPDEFTIPHETASKSRPALQFAIAALSLVLLAAVYFSKRTGPRTEPPQADRAPAPIVAIQEPVDPAVSKPMQPDMGAREEAANLPTKAVQMHLQSLVRATATLSGNGVMGSAFFISRDGYLITNNHVTEKMRDISVATADGTSRRGELIRSDPHLDLALVKVVGGPYPTLKLGDATTLEQGESVWTIGAPHGLSFTVTRGIVSFVGRNVGGKAFIQADVAINPGNSGGPMINERGEAVGINNFIISDAVGLNFAIPINYIYMGMDPIAHDVVSTSPDNNIMAQWRSWERQAPSVAGRTSGQSPRLREEPSSDEIDRLTREAMGVKNLYDQKRNQQESVITRLKSQLTEQQGRYQGYSETISQESAQGARVRKLAQEILREEISLADATLEYCGRQEALLAQIQTAALGDDQLSAQVNSQINQIRQLRTSTQGVRNSKIAELKDASEATY